MAVRVLIIDARAKRASALEQALTEAGFDVIRTATEQDDLHRLMEQLTPDAVLVDNGLPSRDIIEHLGHVSRRFPRPMIMFSQHQDPGLTRQAAKAGVSAYVVEGVVPSLVKSLIEVAIENFDTHQKLRHELTRTRETLTQRRVIDRAKTALMEQYGVNEETAYAQLRKLAMDQRATVFEMSRDLLDSLTAGDKS